ncbi:3-hydroxyacyl-CoA dehydrogenase NAD-binding domain-containing protein [Noviherbaspirillum saxi]|uniref:3-hydroxyacyl-CoA dehydrogenase n=1 Tax=Noviherbaspirillum saxi TaxID=2320863 RepID=A0A3A3FH64_9BURK|nr:3-hydroxyacyl-CoA dehydrogenase NAD-binding domain-containing protein [Noviherbaspirillum saxi]RJF92487.1 3-hydroxyacyl-CoA dehydrogenase [Noviherbaspirillum saxi]
MNIENNVVVVTDTVRYAEQDGVAVILLDNAPVNGLGNTVRQGIAECLTRATDSANVRAVVITGKGKVFCGGADIRQFNTPAATEAPMLRHVIRAIELSEKPVIAAIHGVALGGGLELALGCHYRVTTADASLGLPEVNLGLVPGGGGTQRLPRLVGIRAAIEFAQSGKPVRGEEAVALGLTDALIEGDVMAAGMKFARSVADRGGPHPVIGQKPPADVDGIDFGAVAAAVNPKARNGRAQRAAISCMEASTRLPLEVGLDYERFLFDELVAGPESKALRHMFFAEREALKVEGLAAGTSVRSIRSVGILGAGTMGAGIAMAFANAGISVTMFEKDQPALDGGLKLIRQNYEITASKGTLSPDDVKKRLDKIATTLDMGKLADADLVIEAVFEDMAVKQSVFRQLDDICKPDAILATNTSRLNIDEIAASTRRPESVIGLHFFSPANVMKLLEVVRGKRTSDQVIASCIKMAQVIGKTPVLVGVCEGFVGNRMLTGYWREAGFLLEEGASPQQVDGAMTRFGFAMGPLAMADLAGLDINWATRKRLAATRPAHLRYSRFADRICELGRFGQKTGAGYYRYEPGSRTPIPDSVADELIVQCAKEAGIARRTISDEEIVERCVLALVNEGARILQEGIAQRASDIDVVYVNGYGFPAWRGGPMFYAETSGIDAVLQKIRTLHEVHGEHWTPAPLLVQLVEQGRTRFQAA